jgi:nickel-dependent lactate racemase
VIPIQEPGVTLMVEAWLPYGRTEVAARIPDENSLEIIDVQSSEGVTDPVKEVEAALEAPVESARLDEIVKAEDTVAIVVDEKPIRSPARLMLSGLLKSLGQAGVRDENITVIFGCGAYSMTGEEGAAIIGEALGSRIKIEIHDCHAEDLQHVGKTSFGTPVLVNKTFMESDIRILTGNVAPHYFAGYSGGRKSVLPAIVGIETVRHNHAFLLNPQARRGNLEGNPVHLDMEEALQLVDVDFAVNVVVNPQRDVVSAFAGDVSTVFSEGVRRVNEMCKVNVAAPADIVIVSPGGSPWDDDLYKAYEGVESALSVVKDKGVVVLVAECLEGYAVQAFHDWMVKFTSLSSIRRAVKRRFVLGGDTAYYLRRALGRVKIILVSIMPDYYATGVFKLKTAKTVNAALKSAFRMTGRKSSILVLPHGSATLPIINQAKDE